MGSRVKQMAPGPQIVFSLKVAIIVQKLLEPECCMLIDYDTGSYLLCKKSHVFIM